MRMQRWLVLDAMGVLYEAGDDVKDVLIPFLRDRRCRLDDGAIEALYLSASLGEFSSDEFRQRCGVQADDREYVANHRLATGALELLRAAERKGVVVACLSNDVSEWSRHLRNRFDLAERIDVWCVSGDMGVRKPEAEAYRRLFEETGAEPANCLFVDDRQKNVEAAKAVGLPSVQLGEHGVPTLAEVVQLM